MLKRLFNSQFFKGSVVFTSASFIVNILNYIFNLLIARFFPLAAYGEYMAAMSYMMFFAVPFGAISVLLIKRIGATSLFDRHAYVDLLEKWVFSYLKKYSLIIVLTSLIVGVVLITTANLALESVIFILSMTLLSLISILYLSALQAFKKFFESGGVGLLVGVLKILGGGLVVWLIPHLSALYMVVIFSTAVSFYFYRNFVKKINIVQKTKSVLDYVLSNPLGYIQKKSVLIPLFATLGMVGIINVDVMLVKKFFVADDVGLYAGLALLGKIILYVSAPLSAVAYTFFTGSESKHNGKKILLITTALLVIAGGVAFIGYSLFPELIISVIFGEKFLGVVGLVQLAAIFGVLYSLANLFSQYFIAEGHPLSLLSLVALIAQVGGVILYHQSFSQVLWVSIFVTGLLLLTYAGFLVINTPKSRAFAKQKNSVLDINKSF